MIDGMEKRYPVWLSFVAFTLIVGACSGDSSGKKDVPPVTGDKATVASATPIAPGAICANGGIQVDTGIDENGNGLLDSDEIDNTQYVCNGEDGNDGQDGSDGEDGHSTLIVVTEEPVGDNCDYGGSRIDTGLDLDRDGQLSAGEVSATTYLCRSAVNVPANGYAVTDAWGEVWDGVARPMATQTDAKAACDALGGRLPTATELYRNNLTTGLSSSSISTPSDVEYLWTGLPAYGLKKGTLVRLSDGLVTTSESNVSKSYRCVWPDTSPADFDDDNCNVRPGESCWSMTYGENVDTYDRPRLDVIAASAECAFVHASIPQFSDWNNLIHDGLPNATNNWLWSSKATYWYNGGFGHSVIRWKDGNESSWAYGSTEGTASDATPLTRLYFRCIGNRKRSELVTPVPTCEGGCFSTTHHGSLLTADSTDRAAATEADAAVMCRTLGATLPNQQEMSDLIHAGLPNGSAIWIWLDEALYWYNNGVGYPVINWTDIGSDTWSYSTGNGERSGATSTRPYRCVWHQKVNTYPTCGTTDGLNRVQNSYVCAPSVNGDSQGNANPSGISITDHWGNDWDLLQRGAVTFTEADEACEALGARLPTASEVYAVRADQSLTDSIGDSNAVSYLWTKTVAPDASSQMTIRVSDGMTTALSKTATTPYRCIWPSSKGDVLSGRSCYFGCFTPDSTLIADSFDRAALPVSAAVEECKAAGGHLPDLREFQELVQQGWENGSNTWLWVNESLYWYSGHYGHAAARWSGVGTGAWARTTTTGTMFPASSSLGFRCVYSNRVK